MAIYFDSSNPSGLLTAFKAAIDAGHVETWSYDKDGDFTHTPAQWKGRAWLRPGIGNSRLTMRFLGRQSETTTWEVYSVYHGRFIESMMAHCNQRFSEARSPSQPTTADNITKVA